MDYLRNVAYVRTESAPPRRGWRGAAPNLKSMSYAFCQCFFGFVTAASERIGILHVGKTHDCDEIHLLGANVRVCLKGETMG